MRDRLSTALKQAQADGEKRRAATLRLVQTAIKDRDAAAREQGRDGVSDEEIVEILKKMVRQRDISAQDFEESGQLDLADQERSEGSIIREFLPLQLGDDAIEAICEKTVEEIDAHGLRDIGRCMSELKARYPGQMDFVRASCVVRDLLREKGKQDGQINDGAETGTGSEGNS